MSADSKSVHADTLATLGTIIDATHKRDAIHLAVIPMVARQTLFPGDHIDMTDDGVVYPSAVGKGKGIVDPFLTSQIAAGQHFWMFLYPRTITSLRHVWEHPSFPNEVQA